MKSIICTECKKAIEYKDDLRVAGKLLHPYHSSCLSNPKTTLGKIHRFTGSFPTGLKFWILLIVGNLISGGLTVNNSESIYTLALFTIVFNSVFIFGRIAIYYSYEKYLK